jgi:ABC-type dipeptide/oligopeptide/nickel transport system permease subunit
MTAEAAGKVRPPAIRRSWRLRLAAVLQQVLRNRIALVGLVIVAVQIGAAILAPLLLSYPPDAIDYRAMLQGPSPAHLLGTDDLGRDILSRLIYGARLSLAVSTMAVILAVVLGVPLGLVSGYLGGWIDELLMRLLDSVMALPPLVLALTISAVLGPGLFNAMIAIAIVAVPTFTRLVRGQVLSLKHNDYVTAAHSVGVPTWWVLFRHILPNALNPVIVQATLGVGFAIITESSLSFIGLGAQPPTSTWGSMVQVGFQYLELAPWYVLAPATMMFLAVLGFNMLGDGLRDALDPLSRSR